jgi:hypothetical protein
LINQEVDFASPFCPIRWVSACVASTQRRSKGSAVYRLPFLLDAALATVETQHGTKNLFPNALWLPGLKMFVQDAARNIKPCTVHCFPLTASPQDKPKTVHHGAIGFSAASWSRLTLLLEKVLFGYSTYRTGYLMIMWAFGFCGILFYDESRFVLAREDQYLSQIGHLVHPPSVFR